MFLCCVFYEVSVGYFAYVLVLFNHGVVNVYASLHEVGVEVLGYDHIVMLCFSH